jgi:hypothetical protein
MQIPITIVLDAPDFDWAARRAVEEAKKAVDEWDDNVAFVKKSKEKTTIYDVEFVSMKVSVDLNSFTEYVYVFEVID